MNEPNSFVHKQSAHCESGVLASMLSNSGFTISEPMVFGLASALSFAYIPVVKLSGMPLVSYRMPPKSILRGLQKRLGFKMQTSTFKDAEKGMQMLDSELAQRPFVGLQTSVYWLPYFPDAMRFHFNAHNLMAIKKESDRYLISDPVFEKVMYCDESDLRKARFAKGALAAKGFMYFPESLPEDIDWERQIKASIKTNYKYMTKAPLPVIGVRGIRFLAKKITRLAAQPDKAEHFLPHFLNHIVRMQEEIGTGGAGFRFLYASYLAECGQMLGEDRLLAASEQMTEVGDTWRAFAVQSSKFFKRRGNVDVNTLSALLKQCADDEEEVWRFLKAVC